MAHDEHREEIVIDDHPHSFDTSEPKAGFIAAFGMATIITLVVTVFGIQFYFDQAKEHQVYEQVLKPEGEDLRVLRAKEDQQLSGYSYADKQKGVVRIPIDRAMQLYVQEAGAGKFAYPTANAPIKTDTQLAPGGAPAQPGTAANTAASQSAQSVPGTITTPQNGTPSSAPANTNAPATPHK
jgi:hypothetical protein